LLKRTRRRISVEDLLVARRLCLVWVVFDLPVDRLRLEVVRVRLVSVVEVGCLGLWWVRGMSAGEMGSWWRSFGAVGLLAFLE